MTKQHDFILLDRSGSMSSMWDEAISSVNVYMKKLAEEKIGESQPTHQLVSL